jgi:hypothetical protein
MKTIINQDSLCSLPWGRLEGLKSPFGGLRGLLGGFILLLCLSLASCEKDDPYVEPTPTPTPTPDPDPPVVKENIVFNLDGNLIRAGKEKTGDAVFNLDGDYIRAGGKIDGDIVFNRDDKLIRAGKDKSGDVVFNIDGNYIHAGASTDGDIVFNMDGEYVRGGEGKEGQIFQFVSWGGTDYKVFVGDY